MCSEWPIFIGDSEPPATPFSTVIGENCFENASCHPEFRLIIKSIRINGCSQRVSGYNLLYEKIPCWEK